MHLGRVDVGILKLVKSSISKVTKWDYFHKTSIPNAFYMKKVPAIVTTVCLSAYLLFPQA